MADSILHVHYLLGVYAIVQFLADRTNSCTYAIALRLSVVCDVMYCGVAKRCVLEQKLLLTAY